MSSIRHGLFALIAVTVAASSALPLHAQTEDDPVVKLVAEPAELTMRVGDEAEVKITGVTRSGAQVDAPSVRLVGPRSAVRVREGVVTALEAGDHALIATLVQGAGAPAGEPVMVRVPVRIDWPAVARVVVTPLTDHRLLAGTTIRLGVRAEHANGSERPDPEIEWRSDTPGIATVDGFGRVTASAPGTAAITATVDGVEGTATLSADPFTGSTLHNIWVEDDILYQAYYEGGVRMVDVSGELMGNLYTGARDRRLQGLRPGRLRAQFPDGVERHAVQGAHLLLGHELRAVVGPAGAAEPADQLMTRGTIGLRERTRLS